jgi:hypothetical protein
VFATTLYSIVSDVAVILLLLFFFVEPQTYFMFFFVFFVCFFLFVLLMFVNYLKFNIVLVSFLFCFVFIFVWKVIRMNRYDTVTPLEGEYVSQVIYRHRKHFR